MWTDPIVAEVRKVREEYAKKFGYDIERIFADLKKSEKKRVAAAGRGEGKKNQKSTGAKPKPIATKRRNAA